MLATRIDLGLVDLLARLTLTARRAGAVVRVVPDGNDLQGLLQLAGLDRELRKDGGLRSSCDQGSSGDHRKG